MSLDSHPIFTSAEEVMFLVDVCLFVSLSVCLSVCYSLKVINESVNETGQNFPRRYKIIYPRASLSFVIIGSTVWLQKLFVEFNRRAGPLCRSHWTRRVYILDLDASELSVALDEWVKSLTRVHVLASATVHLPFLARHRSHTVSVRRTIVVEIDLTFSGI